MAIAQSVFKISFMTDAASFTRFVREKGLGKLNRGRREPFVSNTIVKNQAESDSFVIMQTDLLLLAFELRLYPLVLPATLLHHQITACRLLLLLCFHSCFLAPRGFQFFVLMGVFGCLA